MSSAVRSVPCTFVHTPRPSGRDFPADRIELIADKSLAANRPLNWNLLGSLSPTEV